MTDMDNLAWMEVAASEPALEKPKLRESEKEKIKAFTPYDAVKVFHPDTRLTIPNATYAIREREPDLTIDEVEQSIQYLREQTEKNMESLQWQTFQKAGDRYEQLTKKIVGGDSSDASLSEWMEVRDTFVRLAKLRWGK